MTAVRPSQHSGWVEALRTSDAAQLWCHLLRVVRRHPLARTLETRGINQMTYRYADLTQELFVTLLAKGRFQHYLETSMNDAEIEREISQIELSNMLKDELRKRRPESYRVARRVSALLQTSPRFRRFGQAVQSDDPPRRLTCHIYGLSHWPEGKSSRSQYDVAERVSAVHVRSRDRQLKGCSGDAQVVINNAELERLIIDVLEAADAPLDVKKLRHLVMSRLPLLDISLVSLEFNDLGQERRASREVACTQATPEEELLKRDREQGAETMVEEFLMGLRGIARNKEKQYERLLRILWLYYVCSGKKTQLEVAAELGVSDSLISNYRHRIEASLRALSFIELEEARRFETALRKRLSRELQGGQKQEAVIAPWSAVLGSAGPVSAVAP